MYSTAWDTSSVTMTFTMKGVAEDGGDITETMSLLDWYDCLNGAAGAKYDWSANALPQNKRLQLIAALEKEVLQFLSTSSLLKPDTKIIVEASTETSFDYVEEMGFEIAKYKKYKTNVHVFLRKK